MAITDIPEFVEAAPSDLIRSQDLNNVQRQVRNSVRTHRHTRVAGAPVDDAATADLALQITTDEIPDQAVTAAKLADGAVTSGKLANGAVTGPRLADNAVGTTKILNGSISTEKLQADAVTSDKIRNEVVNLPKLDLQEVKDGSQGLSAASSTTPAQVNVDVLAGLTTALSTIFFPVATLAAVAGGTAAEVDAAIIYRRTPTTPGTGVDLRLRLRNSGTSSATVNWQVLTFAPFAAPAPYGYGFRAAIGGELV